MKEKLKIILMIFALGLFVIPKQSFSPKLKILAVRKLPLKIVAKKTIITRKSLVIRILKIISVTIVPLVILAIIVW